jgi:hypothetical protein
MENPSQVDKWKTSLTDKERRLHELAAVMLKKTIKPKDMPEDKDNGSYYADKCHAFKRWQKENAAKTA